MNPDEEAYEELRKVREALQQEHEELPSLDYMFGE